MSAGCSVLCRQTLFSEGTLAQNNNRDFESGLHFCNIFSVWDYNAVNKWEISHLWRWLHFSFEDALWKCMDDGMSVIESLGRSQFKMFLLERRLGVATFPWGNGEWKTQSGAEHGPDSTEDEEPINVTWGKSYGSLCSHSQLFLFAIKTYFQWLSLTIVGETWLVKGKKASQCISIPKGIMGSPNYLGVINNLDPSSNIGPQLSTPYLLVLFFEAVASAWYRFLTSLKRVISISREPSSSLCSWDSWKKSFVFKDIEETPLRLLC